MADYDDRSIIQLPGGTDAVRQTITLGDRELWANVDGSGNPTGEFFVGDGSTAGGIPLVFKEHLRVFDGSIVETIDIDVVEDTGAVELHIQASGGGDLTCQIGGIRYTLDCTPSPAEIALTVGTDVSPTQNWVWIAESGGSVSLVAGTSGFPSTPHCPVATVIVQSAASLATDGAYKVHAWTDHLYKSGENGHIAHLNAKLRALQASWIDGVTPGDLSVSSPDAYVDVTAGNVFQLHPHTFPARDMSLGDPVWIVNDPTTAYKRVTTFDDITQDASGGTINNRWMNLVLWGVVSEDAADCKLMINLPTDTYATASAAVADDQATAVYSFPDGYTGTAFLIARYIVQGKDSGAWAQDSKIDLRGLLPSSSAGGGGLPSHSSLPDLSNDDHTQYARTDGTRNITGAQTFEDQAIVEGLLSATGNFQTVNALPTWVMWDTTHTDSDGGRLNLLQCAGERASGSQHYQHWLYVQHDGAGNDEKTRIVWLLNRSDTGVGTPDELMRLDDHLKVQGELRAFSTRRTHRYNAAATAILAGGTNVPFATDQRTDAEFTWNGTFDECTVNFTGTVEVGYDITAENGTVDTWAGSRWEIHNDTGGGFGFLAGTASEMSHPNVLASLVTGSNCVSCRPRLVAVTSGDKFKVVGTLTSSTGTCLLVVGACRISLRRVAGALP